MLVYLQNFETDGEAWIQLPTSNKEISRFLKEEKLSTFRHPDYFITDSTAHNPNLIYDIPDFVDIYELNEQIKTFEALAEEEQRAISSCIEYFKCSLREALARYKTIDYYDDILTPYNLGYHLTISNPAYLLPESLSSYFDYEEFGKDFSKNGAFCYFGFILPH